MTFKNINFGCLFTLHILGMEMYLIDPSFSLRKEAFTSEHGKHELPSEVIAQEWLNASVPLAKLNFTILGFRVLGKGERKKDRPGWKK